MVVLIVNIIIGIVCGYIFEAKNRNYTKGLWWGILLGPLGLIIVLFFGKKLK
jgi:hypothetical protein